MGIDNQLWLMADKNISGEGTEEKEARITKKALKRLQARACAKLHCECCPERRFTSLQSYNDHLQSKTHKRRKLKAVSKLAWSCTACDITLATESEWVKHVCGSRHDKKLKEMGLKLFPVSKPLAQEDVDSLDESAVQEEEEEEEEEEDDLHYT